MMLCSHCSYSLDPLAKFCEECGTPVGGAAVLNACKCGSRSLDDQGYCVDCGCRQHVLSAPVINETSAMLACVSDVGRKHPINQDAAQVAVLPDGSVFLGVADGVSSSNSSELASSTAVSVALNWLANKPTEDLAVALSLCVEEANAQVKTIPYKPLPDLDEPETTLVVAVVRGATLHVAWVGDSRAYAMSSAGIRQLTRDDSWMTDAIENGMSYDDAAANRNAHAITQCLGMQDEEIIVRYLNVELASDEQVVVCTDGLWNYFESVEELHTLFKSVPRDASALTTAQMMVDAANAAGGRDNVSVAVLRR